MEGSGSRKIVEVFIDTDTDSESSSSAEGNSTPPPPGTIPVEAAVTQESSQDQPPYPEGNQSPLEADISFHEDSLDISNIGMTFEPSTPVPDHPPLMPKSPAAGPKPLDPNREYCFCRQLPDSHSMIHCHQCLEWFHGECVGLTRQKAAAIKSFYCPLCIDKNPTLVSVFETKAEGKTATPKGLTPHDKKSKTRKVDSLDDLSLKKKGVAKKGKPLGKDKVKRKAKGKPLKPRRKNKLLSSLDFDFEDIQRPVRRTRQPFSDIGDVGYFREEPPSQCLGPGCVLSARPHSKYCSEECGVQLALKRIHKHLPAGKALADDIEPQASLRNKKNLEKLENDQKVIRKKLEELEKQTVAIDDHVAQLDAVTPVSEDEIEGDSDDLTIHCPTCSHPVTIRKAMNHFERCFNRLEGMVSFGSIVKNEGTNIFCDKFDSVQKTYCKRLRVLCPEHTKEPKIGADEVCGCPLEATFPSQLCRSELFCRLPRKSCSDHYCWEKIRKAEIDQQKLNLFLKLEELSEQTRLNQWQINCRGSMLALMLHHTVNHTHSDTPSSNHEQMDTTCSS